MVITGRKKIHAVIVAAGSGSRYGGELPKQFLLLAGEPVLCHSIRAFRRTFPQCEITVVLSEWGRNYWTEFCHNSGFEPGKIVIGGKTRSESVRNAISGIEDDGESLVMVHDGARPLICEELLRELAEAAAEGAGSVPALPITDSMIELSVENEMLPVPRSNFRTVQTPQVFPLHILKEVYSPQARIESYTDELSAVLTFTDLPVKLVPGQGDNIKITNPGDLERAEFLLKKR